MESLEDHRDKQLAVYFQKLQMLRRFNNWDPSLFLFFNSDKDCCVYDSTSYTNRAVLPSLSSINKDSDFNRLMCQSADGPLVVLHDIDHGP